VGHALLCEAALTGIYLRGACSCYEYKEEETAGAGRGAPPDPGEEGALGEALLSFVDLAVNYPQSNTPCCTPAKIRLC
jgi:hypothetical protein